MSKNKNQTSLLEAQMAAFNEQQQAILHRLQIDALPEHETCFLPVTHIQIPDESRVLVPGSLVQSIGRFGVLQAPAVVRCSSPEEMEEYEVISGRRRTKGARLAGLSTIKCEVYASSTPQLSALLALIENAQRSAAWIKEVADLRLLISQRVGMTVPELVACGFARAGLEQRLKIAQLPAPLLDQVVAGEVPLVVARKLVRLTSEQLARVVVAAQDTKLSAELVKQALKAQISADMSPMQIVFPAWDIAQSTGHSWSIDAEDTTSANLSPLDLLTTLRAFTQSDAYHQVEDAQILVQALIQRLEMATRETSPRALAR